MIVIAAVLLGFVFGILASMCYTTMHLKVTAANAKKGRSWDSLATGISGNTALEIAWLEKASELFSVYISKQRDYGTTNISLGGLSGVVIRIGDKVSRLWELLGINSGIQRSCVNEPVRDTLLDLANYAIITLLLFDGDWNTITPRQAWISPNTEGITIE